MTKDHGSWVRLSAAEADVVSRIAAVVHPTLPERLEVFREKLTLFPEGGFKWVEDGNALGYGLCHPYRVGAVPKLDTFLGAIPNDSGCLFVHDVSLLPEARGRGVSRACFLEMARVAERKGLPTLALVAVYGTDVLWARLGFRMDPRVRVEGYGDEGRYMIADVRALLDSAT